MRWMNLESVIQSEVSQKEKDKYRILTHINGIQKNDTEELIYRAAMRNRHREQSYGHGEKGGEHEIYGKNNTETYITICKIDNRKLPSQETQTGALYQSRGVEWGGRWEGGSKGSGYMYTYG